MIPLLCDALPMAHHVLVVGQEQVVRQLWPVEVQPQVVVKGDDVVLVEAFQLPGPSGWR